MRVLLVEDDCMIGEAVQQALKDASYAYHAVIFNQQHPHSLTLQQLGLYAAFILWLCLSGEFFFLTDAQVTD